MGEVDEAFIHQTEHRPKLQTIEDEGMPLIDLSVLNQYPPKSDLEDLVQEIGKACMHWGFSQVINHGASLELREKSFNVSKQVFEESLEEKRKVRRDEVNPLGYYDTEHTKNVRDWKEVFDDTYHNPSIVPASYEPHDDSITKWYNQNQWPFHLPEFKI